MDFCVSNSTGPQNDKIPYLDIAIKKEHPFVRNIFSDEELNERIITVDSYYFNFTSFIRIVSLLNKLYSAESDIEDTDDCTVDFISRN